MAAAAAARTLDDRAASRHASEISVLSATRLYGRVRALDAVDFSLRAGTVHALVGENGAGKTTLVKILAGAVQPTSGELQLDGHPQTLRNPRQATRAGVAVVHQDAQVFPDLTVAENILGSGRLTPTHGPFVARRAMRERTAELLAGFDIDIDADARARTLGSAERKLVDVARALAGDARFLILDEPTASLEPFETEYLLQLITRLRDRGHGILFVTHRLDEVLQIADMVTILRDGRSMGTFPRSELDTDRLVELIVGGHPEAPAGAEVAGTEKILELRRARLRPEASTVGFEVCRGEIIALTGLLGSGARAALRTLAGRRPKPAKVYLDGSPVRVRHSLDAIRLGIGYIPEDRKLDGLVAGQSVETNVALARLPAISRFGFVDRRARRRAAEDYAGRLSIRCDSVADPVSSLSGGNQQKVLIAKWLAANVRVLLVEEPTHGVDIGARAEIHRHLIDFAREGGAVVMVSTDLSEVANVCHRVVVFRHGSIVAELAGAELTEDAITRASSGFAEHE